MKAILTLTAALLVSQLALAGDPLKVPPIIDADAVKRSVDPCTDFYQFACGQWLDDLTLPSDKSTYYHQFTALEDQTQEAIRTLIGSAPADSKIAKFYASCMDEDSASRSAADTLGALFAQIDQVSDDAAFARLTARMHLLGANVLFGFGPAQDLNDASRVIAFASQGGLSLPERDYYQKTDDAAIATRREFAAHVARSLVLAGAAPDANTAQLQASWILDLETRLASAAYSLEDQGDPSKINHPIGDQGLKALAPAFQWDTYYAGLGLVSPGTALNVTEPDFYSNLNLILTKTSLQQLKAYYKWQVVKRSASLAGKELDAEAFAFWQRHLRGKQQPEPRWKRCVSIVSSNMSDEVGKAFVGTISDADQVKTSTRGLIEAIKSVFSANLDLLSWLDAPTVSAAREKLTHVNDKVAFPDKWKDYGELLVDASALLANDIRATELASHRALVKISKPVDRTEWQMPPWEINAYYDPSMNEIVFPYGILQKPVFDLTASDAANMGALGATVGHELTHGFDNDGSKYDGYGNVKNWWPDAIRAKFEQGAQCLIDQANHYEVLPGLFVNGTRTLGENIADQGGTKLAYVAYKRMAANRPPAAPVAGFSEEQQFFVSYAQSWCSKRTPESMRLQLISNTHPPEEFRVNGVLMNLPQFAEAFGCRAGARMAPVNRCAVW